MKEKSIMVVALQLIGFATVWCVLNGLYAEYCLSREVPIAIVVILGAVMIVVNIFGIAKAAKWLKKNLNL